MNNLGSFLDKFKNLIGSSKFQKDAVLSVIKSVANIELKDSEVDIKDYVVFVKASPIVRSELFMRKQKILTALQAALGKKAPKDLR